MKKKRKVSMAWFLFFGASSCLLSSQLEAIAAILAGFMIAWFLTSRIKIKLLYVVWLIFPVLSLIFISSIGDGAVRWCEENNPSDKIDKALCYLEEKSDQKVPKAVHDFLLDKSPEAVDNAKDKIKVGFNKAVDSAKDKGFGF